MTVFRKVISLILVFALLITMLTACDDNTKEEDVKKSVKAYAEPLTVKFAFSNLANQPSISKIYLQNVAANL